ncbi:MAG: tetratricopeptide repeat protein [Deltaproteobacteria bacterium]|nr:tetratricopeptide repeat protein [Deltaproteobacteria bacterium]
MATSIDRILSESPDSPCRRTVTSLLKRALALTATHGTRAGHAAPQALTRVRIMARSCKVTPTLDLGFDDNAVEVWANRNLDLEKEACDLSASLLVRGDAPSLRVEASLAVSRSDPAKALELIAPLIGPSSSLAVPLRARAAMAHGGALSRLHRADEALGSLGQAAADFRRQGMLADALDAALTADGALAYAKRHEDRPASLAELESWARQSIPEEPIAVAMVLTRRAVALGELKRFDEAIEANRRVFEIAASEYGEMHSLALNARSNIAVLEQIRGNLDAALAMHQKLLSMRLAAEDGPEGIANSYESIGAIYTDTKRGADAEPYCRKAMEVREQKLPIRHRDRFRPYECLALALGLQGKQEAAIRTMDRAVEIGCEAHGRQDPTCKGLTIRREMLAIGGRQRATGGPCDAGAD